MRQNKAYITPGIKVRAIRVESDLLAASPETIDVSLSGSATTDINGGTGLGEDEIGAKAHGGSDGWDDWSEDE